MLAMIIESRPEGGSGEAEIMNSVLNSLCETLCTEINWLSADESLACQMKLRLMTLALYDVCVRFHFGLML